MTPNTYVGRPPSNVNTNVYIQNYYGDTNSGGLWNGYFSRTSANNNARPIMMDSRYYNTGYYSIPSWLQNAMENNYLFSFIQGMINGGSSGGGCGC